MANEKKIKFYCMCNVIISILQALLLELLCVQPVQQHNAYFYRDDPFEIQLEYCHSPIRHFPHFVRFLLECNSSRMVLCLVLGALVSASHLSLYISKMLLRFHIGNVLVCFALY